MDRAKAADFGGAKTRSSGALNKNLFGTTEIQSHQDHRQGGQSHRIEGPQQAGAEKQSVRRTTTDAEFGLPSDACA